MTRKIRWLFPLLAVGVCLGLLLPTAEAQKVKPKTAEEEKAEEAARAADTLGKLNVSRQLAELGRKQDAPDALLSAARLLTVVLGSFRDFEDRDSVQTGRAEGSDPNQALVNQEEDGLGSLEKQARSLIKEARDMADIQGLKLAPLVKQANDALTKKVAEVKAEMEQRKKTGERALFGGPRQMVRMIGPGQWQTMKVFAEPHRPVQFAFQATLPLRVTVVRGDNDNVYGAGLRTGVQATFMTGGSGSGRVPLTVRIINVNRQVAQYQLFMY